jgi:hypothetical protein
MGRPSTKTPETCAAIVERLSAGEPMASICRQDDMPSVTTVWEWQKADSGFSESIARAREVGFDVLAAQCLDIADDATGDTRIVGEDEREVCNTEFVQRAKLRIDTRLKLLAKWDPKRYGDKLAHVGGDDDDAPIKHAISVKFV